MIKLNSKHQSLPLPATSQVNHSTLSPVAKQRIEPARRLIVLVPGIEIDLTAVTRTVWELANTTGACVQFIGLYDDPAHEPSLRRELVTMSAMVKDGRITTEAEVIFGKNWVDVLKMRWQVGDLIVCFAEQRAGLSRKPLSQILQSDLNAPLYILSGLYRDSRSNWLAQAAAWVGSIAIILGFLVLQVKLDHLVQGWAHIVLPLLSIPVEVGMIWAWNSLFE